ncbi:RNA-directed DNA polymerase [Brevibacillus laterosporus]|uniref:RNA-directed DNA polymerase n=1 Tax=Brevibacillus laterosporus TaxID=1465 RepID=UPI0035A6FE35
MQTERFIQLRKNVLSNIFTEKAIVRTWRKIVRDQLRNSDLKDLYDHYDFNYNIKARATSIKSDVLSGNYKISQPMIYRIEKKLGVCRHLVTPQPTDALVFQVLVENVSDKILKNQPSLNAFYSRDKHNVPKPHEMDDYNFNWREQWKEMQKMIYKFNEENELIVVTDLANYYDSIDIKELRKVFSSFSKINEVIIDLIFKIIEEISWKPDYLPYSARGLPTTNIEGIRLLAHSFLFEIDTVIKQKTNDSFTRWMDDIIIGVDTKKKGIETISVISDMLKSRGLALNLSKTNIYNENEAYYQFQIEANRYIDKIEKTIETDYNYKCICKELDKRFKMHFLDRNPKYWDKVSKRYITLYRKLKHKRLMKELPSIYVDFPSLRPNLIYYLTSIGFNKKSASNVLEILRTIDIFDDRSLFQICFLVTQWEIPTSKGGTDFLKNFEECITKLYKKSKKSSDFYSMLWYKSKYNSPEELLLFIKRYKKTWQKDSFLRRQVTAALSRLLPFNYKEVNEILQSQITSGIPNTVTLANQLFLFKRIKIIDTKLQFYLFPNKRQKPYPLSKFLVLCSVLSSEEIRNDERIKGEIREHIKDPYYLKWIDFLFKIT